MTRAGAPLVGLLVLVAGCAVEGDFLGTPFAPVNTMLAVVDRHELVEVNGALVPSLRPAPAHTLSLVLTAARENPGAEWRREPAEALTELRTDLATRDGVYLHLVPVQPLLDDGSYTVWFDRDEANDRHGLVQGYTPPPPLGESVPLGGAIRLTLTVDDMDPQAGGHLDGNLDIESRHADDQFGHRAVGIVSIPLAIPVVAERVGKANLAVALPILACAAAAGTDRGAGCADEDPWPVPDVADPAHGR